MLRYIYKILSSGVAYDRQLDAVDTEKIKASKLSAAKRQVSALESKKPRPFATDDKKSNTSKTVANSVRENKKGIKSPTNNPLSSSAVVGHDPFVIYSEPAVTAKRKSPSKKRSRSKQSVTA